MELVGVGVGRILQVGKGVVESQGWRNVDVGLPCFGTAGGRSARIPVGRSLDFTLNSCSIYTDCRRLRVRD